MYKILIERTNSYYPRPFNSKEEATAFIAKKENLVLTRIGKYNTNLKEIITNIVLIGKTETTGIPSIR